MQSVPNGILPIVNEADFYSSFPDFMLAPQLLYPPLPWSTNQAGLFDPSWFEFPGSAPEEIHGLEIVTAPLAMNTAQQQTIPPVAPIKRDRSAMSKTSNQRNRYLRELKRIETLQNDEFILAFTETEVECAGCGKVIQLDKRNGARYYPGFWLKHKGRCSGVAEGTTAARRREKEDNLDSF